MQLSVACPGGQYSDAGELKPTAVFAKTVRGRYSDSAEGQASNTRAQHVAEHTRTLAKAKQAVVSASHVPLASIQTQGKPKHTSASASSVLTGSTLRPQVQLSARPVL